MGDNKKLRKQYKTPTHPWNKTRILAEAELSKEYGLKNKKEIMRTEFLLSKFKSQAKQLITRTDKQAEVELEQLKQHLFKLGLASGDVQIDNVLDLSVKDLMERRLQTQVVRKGLARSMRQARQFITHGHIMVGSNKLSVPGHLVTVDQEVAIAFSPSSDLASPEHPERKSPEDIKKELEEIKQKEAEAVVENTEEKAEDVKPALNEEPTAEEKAEAPKEEAPAEQPAPEESKEEVKENKE